MQHAWGKEEIRTNCGSENPKERNRSEDPGVYERIILK
jgi:hypothetical protein